MGPAAIRGALMSAGRRVWAGRRRRRALRVTAAACAVTAAVWVMFGSWFDRQLRVIEVVAVALNKPGWLVWAVDETTSTPHSSQQVIASVPSTVVRPAGSGPCTDLGQMVRLATTGTCLRDGRPVRYRTGSFLGLAVARSLVASMPASGEQRTLLSRLRAIPDNAADPLAGLRRSPADRTGPVGAVVALLANRDPPRFDPLWAALPRRLRRAARQLSPLSAAA